MFAIAGAALPAGGGGGASGGSGSGSGCVPCAAVFSFLLGAVGGYLVTVTLGTNDAVDGKGGAGPTGTSTAGAGKDACYEAGSYVDDEGNVVEKKQRSPGRSPPRGPPKGAEEEKKAAAAPASRDAAPEEGGEGSRGIVIVEGEEEDDDSGGGGGAASPAAVASAAAAAAAGGGTEAPETTGPVRVVVQRFRSASLLLRPPSDECPGGVTAAVGGKGSGGGGGGGDSSADASTAAAAEVRCGLLLYVSFARSASESSLYDAALTIMNLPVLTDGKWGDGSGTSSALGMASEGYTGQGGGGGGGGVGVVIVPQANLVSKVKNKGRSIQYHGQIDKDKGKELYERFVDCVRLVALEQSYLARDAPVPNSVRSAILSAGGSCRDSPSSASKSSKGASSASAPDASVPPAEMFRDETLYASWDDSGFPLTKANGEPTTKSARKKMKKQFEAQRKRHDKYLASGGGGGSGSGSGSGEGVGGAAGSPQLSADAEGGASSGSGEKAEEEEAVALPELDPGFISVVGGTFGNLQALEFASDMGPFCHVLNLG